MHEFRWTLPVMFLRRLGVGIILLVLFVIYLSNTASVRSATATSLTITASLQGRASAANQPFDITMVNSKGGFTQVNLSDANGRITLNDLTAGDYSLRFKHPQYLAVTLPIRLAQGANTLNIGPLKGGDANNDNVISAADASFVSTFYNHLAGTDGYDSRADLNADQRVSLLDFSVLSGNYGQAGATALAIPPTSTVRYPSQVINLTSWKITLPLGDSEDPVEITQPELANFSMNPWFRVSDDGKGILFRAPVNGVTTSGSNYPRSELREMTGNGAELASWSSSSGTHTLFIDEAITALPTTKKHIVVGQIHDSSDDVIVIRLEYPNLYVNVDGNNKYTLDDHYELGKRFTIKYVVGGGKTSVYYNGSNNPVYVLSKKYSKSYFKAGAYTQSNCDTEGNKSLCNDNNFGEMVLYQLTVQHQ